MTDYNDGKIHGWNGGPCPVHPETEVRYWLREDGPSHCCKASKLDWKHLLVSFDIIAFQVVEAYSDPVPPRECWSFCSLNFATEAAALDLRVRVAEDNPGKGYEDMPVTKWREVKE